MFAIRNVIPSLTVLILLCNSFFILNYAEDNSEPSDPLVLIPESVYVQTTIQNYTQSDPLVVIGDENFTTNGFSGDGTWQSPYILENVNITTETITALKIVDTTRPFVIRSSLVAAQNDELDFGIYFENVTNGAIERSNIIGFSRSGLYFRYCHNIRVDESSLANCHSAIETWGVWNLTVVNNFIIDSAFYAGLLEMVHDSVIGNNTLFQNKIGFGFSGSSNVSVEYNTIVNGSGGVHYGETRNLKVRRNCFVNLNGSAIFSTSMIQGYSSPDEDSFEFRIDNRIEDNDFNNCSMAFYSDIGYYTQFSNNSVNNCKVGVLLTWSAGNYILDNEFRNCKEYGVHCKDAHLNRVYRNLIVNSGVSNARDEEEGYNYWDDGQSIGNTWDDYIGPGIYRIPGDSVSVDRWPNRFGPPHISVVNETQIIVGTVGTSITWNAFDSDPSSFTIIQNGMIISYGVWNGSDLILSLDGLEIGIYNLTATVMDTNGSISCATVFVEVLQIPVVYYFGIILGVSGIILLVVLMVLFRKSPNKFTGHKMS